MLDLSPSVVVVSFDVFDTVVARNVYHPQDLYSRIQKQLADPGNSEKYCKSIQHFPLNRIAAELKAREQLTGREEVTFDEIVAVLAEQCGLTPESIKAIAACEIEEEIKSVVPVEPLLSLVREMRQAGKQIVFVSDMYLPDNVIRKMLLRVGALEAEDKLYVSGSIGKKKSTGSLFRYIWDDLGIRPNQMIHLGDYLLSDYLIPRLKCGIRSIPVRIARNNVYERLWGEACSCLFCSSIAGASRAARVANTREGQIFAETVLYNTGCNVVGPIITVFILWTLHQAVQAGIKRLYFLSRDGDIMLEIAREVAARCGIAIDLRYLYVSRTAVFPALLGAATDAHSFEWFKEDNIILTSRILADRLKVDVTCLHEQLIRVGIGSVGPDAPLGREIVEQICRLLMTDPLLLEMVSESGRNALQGLVGYVEQEGLFDGIPFALVDLGWHGSIQDALFTCFADRFGDYGISGYYFGVDRSGGCSNRKAGFFFNPGEVSAIAKYQHLFRVLMEVICSARHGMVDHYHLNAHGRYEPVCSLIEDPLNGERVEHLRHGVSSFLKYLNISGIGTVEFHHVRPQILSLLKKLFFCPSSYEATALGGFRFSADQAGHGVHCVAPPFTVVSSLRFLTQNNYAGRSTISSWFFASWKRSSSAARWLLLPLVMCLRVYYLGFEQLSFIKIKMIDSVNTCINGIE
jgi:FMN phosphatase YigB (HAD superfamily)